MAMLSKISRLFTIKTRFEAWLVIYAIALGAVERGHNYLDQYPGISGWILAAACTGVVFVAGAKLLDSVTMVPAIVAGPYRAPSRRSIIDSRPTVRHSRSGSESQPWHRTGSRPARPSFGRREALPEDRTNSPDR